MEIAVLILGGLAVGGLVLLPMLRAQTPVNYDWDGSAAGARREERRVEVESEVQRYRVALRAGTICTRCGQANPPGSRFCGECGRPLRNAPRAQGIAEPVAR